MNKSPEWYKPSEKEVENAGELMTNVQKGMERERLWDYREIGEAETRAKEIWKDYTVEGYSDLKRATAYDHAGEKTEAEKIWTEIAKQGDPRYRARAYERLGDVKGAQNMYREAAKDVEEGNFSNGLESAAEYYEKAGDTEKAKELWQRFILQESNRSKDKSPWAYNLQQGRLLAVAYGRIEDKEKAKTQLEELAEEALKIEKKMLETFGGIRPRKYPVEFVTRFTANEYDVNSYLRQGVTLADECKKIGSTKLANDLLEAVIRVGEAHSNEKGPQEGLRDDLNRYYKPEASTPASVELDLIAKAYEELGNFKKAITTQNTYIENQRERSNYLRREVATAYERMAELLRKGREPRHEYDGELKSDKDRDREGSEMGSYD
jgi:tetratricopeptide (TPR) repeat protein